MKKRLSAPKSLLSPKARHLPLIAAIALAWPMSHVLAQTTAAPKPEAGKLETVNVTAERRSENIKDVPSAVSTISGEKLDVINSAGQDVRMLSGRVPSLNIESSFGRAFPRFTFAATATPISAPTRRSLSR